MRGVRVPLLSSRAYACHLQLLYLKYLRFSDRLNDLSMHQRTEAGRRDLLQVVQQQGIVPRRASRARASRFVVVDRVIDRTLTGTVISSGDGVTHDIPCVEGYVIGCAIKHIPVAGRDTSQT